VDSEYDLKSHPTNPNVKNAKIQLKVFTYFLVEKEKIWLNRAERVKQDSAPGSEVYIVNGKDEWKLTYDVKSVEEADIKYFSGYGYTILFKSFSREEVLKKKEELELKLNVVEYSNHRDVTFFGGGGSDYNDAFDRGWMGRDAWY
jgi:hypothetical protein